MPFDPILASAVVVSTFAVFVGVLIWRGAFHTTNTAVPGEAKALLERFGSRDEFFLRGAKLEGTPMSIISANATLGKPTFNWVRLA